MVASVSSTSIRAERARRSFKLFVEDAWSVIEPGKPFVPGWHLDAIAEHLQAVAEGQITRLLVNMPPRHGKSSLISVLWTSWLLLNDPSTRLLCASYAMNLATRDNVKARRLIKSPWFQSRYRDVFTLAGDQDAKIKFETNMQGYRMAVSVGSAATGEGGDVLVLDDPHNIDEKLSDTKREAAIDWFDSTWSTRLNDQQTGKMVVVGQRIHEQDLSAHILETNDGGEWVHLNLSAEYDSANPCKTYFPSGKELWGDPRKEDGELLWPDKFPHGVIEKAKKRHQLDYFALYQQQPSAPGGNTFKKLNERLCTQSMDAYFLHTPRGIKAFAKEDCTHFLSVDPAISEKQTADFMVIGFWAMTPIKDLLLLDLVRGHWGHNEQQEEVQDAFNEHDTDFVAVETVNYQHALFQDLIIRGMPCKPFTPHKDKIARAATASIWQANGKIYFLKDTHWLTNLQTELYKFPKTAHDDQVDMISLASIVVRSRGPLSDDTSDDEDIPDAAESTLAGEMVIEVTEEQNIAAANSIEAMQADPFAYAFSHGWRG